MLNEPAWIVVMMSDARWRLVERYSREILASDFDSWVLEKGMN
jgi:hypothetical protein